MTFLPKLRTLVNHPYTNCAIALILIGTSLLEGGETLYEDITELDLQAHHGVMIFGLMSLLSSIPDLAEAIERLSPEEREA